MLLWDIIRDWFVQHIWGGYDSSYNYFSGKGGFGYMGSEGANQFDLAAIGVPSHLWSFDFDMEVTYISVADWLSTTSTIIVLVALCFFFFLMVRWLFRLTAGLIQGRG